MARQGGASYQFTADHISGKRCDLGADSRDDRMRAGVAVACNRFNQRPEPVAEPRPEWSGADVPDGGTIGFVGRINEPRKGLPTLLEALPRILAARPGVRLLVAGKGDEEEAVKGLPAEVRARIEFLGMVSDEEKAALLRSVDLYVAPNTGGESFGIILVEAMSASAPVLASDLDAFELVLEGGTVGRTFPVGDAHALAEDAIELLGDAKERARLSEAASLAVRRYDWSVVAADLLAVYEMVTTDPASVARAAEVEAQSAGELLEP